MGLYLCVCASEDEDVEVDGVEIGCYDDLHILRTTIAERLENGIWGSRFPVFMSHADSDGEWTADEAQMLGRELLVIDGELAELPPRPFAADSWQARVQRTLGVSPASMSECFIDVDGEPLLARLRELAEIAVAQGCPISFQ